MTAINLNREDFKDFKEQPWWNYRNSDGEIVSLVFPMKQRAPEEGDLELIIDTLQEFLGWTTY